MGPVIGDILPFAIGVAISPVPIIAVILMLFSERDRQNGPAFLGGWVLGLSAVVVMVLIVAGSAGASTGTPPTSVSWLKVGLGVLLIVLGVRQWRTRPREGESSKQPSWMATIDSLEPSRAVLFGVLLSAVNPKNLTLAIGSALVIAQAGLGAGEEAVAVIVFVLLGSISIIVPVVYALSGGESARRTLDGWKSWLGTHNAAVMTVLLVVLGVALLGKGLGPLIG
jgi:threonine/homoserine/homoserine lactone efflux protein